MMKLKTVLVRVSQIVASAAMALAVLTVNSTCYCYSYQPDIPQALKKHDSQMAEELAHEHILNTMKNMDSYGWDRLIQQ